MNKKFGVPDGRYYVMGCSNGEYKYIRVFPTEESLERNLNSTNVELGPIEVEIRNGLIRLPLDLRVHIGAVGSGFSMLALSHIDHFSVWRNYRYQKYAGLGLYERHRNVA